MRRACWLTVLVALVTFSSGCSAIGGVFGGVSGGSATDTDDSCDRRFAPAPQAFCQEIVNTLAGTPFQQDCVNKFDASPSPGLCSRVDVIGGCEYNTVYQDGSRVTDWYYDISSLDGGVDAFPPSQQHLTIDEITALCADDTRYQGGATFVPVP